MSNRALTADQLKEMLDYNPETGIFIRKNCRRGRVKNGDIAGCRNFRGCIMIKLPCSPIGYMAHRLAWLYMTGDWPKNLIDHIDGDPSNNRFSNLRDVDQSTNSENLRQMNRNTKSGLMGVKVCKGYFEARITVLGKQKALGCFKSAVTAHEAYLKAKREFHNGCTI